MTRDEGGKLLARTVCHLPTGHKNVPDGITIDAGGQCQREGGQR